MAKLTLSVDEAVVERAKEVARRRGTSVSALVERFLDALARPGDGAGGRGTEASLPPRPPLPPITARLAGLLRGARVERESYRRYLEQKYR